MGHTSTLDLVQITPIATSGTSLYMASLSEVKEIEKEFEKIQQPELELAIPKTEITLNQDILDDSIKESKKSIDIDFYKLLIDRTYEALDLRQSEALKLRITFCLLLFLDLTMKELVEIRRSQIVKFFRSKYLPMLLTETGKHLIEERKDDWKQIEHRLGKSAFLFETKRSSSLHPDSARRWLNNFLKEVSEREGYEPITIKNFTLLGTLGNNQSVWKDPQDREFVKRQFRRLRIDESKNNISQN